MKILEILCLRIFFALAHHEINRLLSYLNSRIRNGHYNAAESRQLLKWIKIVEDTIYAFKKSETPIESNASYFQGKRTIKYRIEISVL